MTITDIAAERGIKIDSARKNIARHLLQHGREMPAGISKTDVLPDWVVELLDQKPVAMNGATVENVTVPAPPQQAPAPKPEPPPIHTEPPAEPKPEAEFQAPIPEPEPTPTPKPTPPRTALDRVFGSETNILLAVAVLVIVDGISFSRLGVLAFGPAAAIQVAFAVVGFVVGYAALQNTYTLNQSAVALTSSTERRQARERVGKWVAVFAIAEICIHGVAVGLVGDWSGLDPNRISGLILICIVVPVAKAGLTVIIFKPKS